MFIRKLKNRSGTLSIQIISKSNGKYQVVKTVGCASNERETQKLFNLAKQELDRLSQQSKLFISEKIFR